MNFFGHAVAASWVSSSPAFAYGAMLPDLVPMVGARLSGATDPELSGGIAFHHLTDRCFHEHPTFVGFEHRARVTLERAAVRKGPRRALAHVGIELMLDAVLAENDAHLDTVQQALRYGKRASGIVFRHRSLGARVALRGLSSVLLTRTAKLERRNAAQLVQHMERVLSGHPKLGFVEREREAVTRWAQAAHDEVRAGAEAWVEGLRDQVVAAFHGQVAKQPRAG